MDKIIKNIKIDDVSFSIRNKKLISNISFDFEEGDIVGLIGPNGAGKSTLLKCIYGVLKPDSGSILFDDIDKDKIPSKTRASKMSVVSQHNASSFDFNVLDMVLMGRSPYKKLMERDTEEDYKIANESLVKVGMLEYKDRGFMSLSGGERQRVVLARSLAQDTKFMILDEPTNHLDIQHQLQFLKIIEDSKKTCLMALHDLNIALQYCNKIAVLKDGILIEFGNTKDVISEELISKVYNVNAKIIDVEGKPNVIFIKK